MYAQVYACAYKDYMLNVHVQTHMYNISLALPTLLRTRNYLAVLSFIALILEGVYL